MLDDFNAVYLAISALCAQNTQYGQRPSVTADITISTTNIDCVQGWQQDMPVMEMVVCLCMEERPGTEDTENIMSWG